MAWSRVQSVGAAAALANNVLTQSVTLGAAPTTGDIIVAVVSISSGTSVPTIASVKDGNGNSFTLVKDIAFTTTSTDGHMAVYVLVVPASPSTTVTANFTNNPSGAGSALLAVEFSGTTATLDGTAAGNNQATGSITQPAYSSSASNELLISALGDDGDPTLAGAGGSWTADPNNVTASTHGNVGLQWKNSTNGAETGGTWSDGAGGDAGIVVVAFQLPASPGGPALRPTQGRRPLPPARARAMLQRPVDLPPPPSDTGRTLVRRGPVTRTRAQAVVLGPPRGTAAAVAPPPVRAIVARGPQTVSAGQVAITLSEMVAAASRAAVPIVVSPRSSPVRGRAHITVALLTTAPGSLVPARPLVLRRPYAGTRGRARVSWSARAGQAVSLVPARPLVLRRPYAGTRGRARVSWSPRAGQTVSLVPARPLVLRRPYAGTRGRARLTVWAPPAAQLVPARPLVLRRWVPAARAAGARIAGSGRIPNLPPVAPGLSQETRLK